MKSQTLLVVVLFFALLIECESLPVSKPNLGQINEECSKLTGMNINVVKNIIATGNMIQPSETYYKFLECVYKRQNYFDDKGYVSYATIENFLSSMYEKSVLRRAMAPCENLQTGSSMGERAYNAGSCIIKNLGAIEAEDDGESVNSSDEATNTV